LPNGAVVNGSLESRSGKRKEKADEEETDDQHEHRADNLQSETDKRLRNRYRCKLIEYLVNDGTVHKGEVNSPRR
jgi:hypothetical protein